MIFMYNNPMMLASANASMRLSPDMNYLSVSYSSISTQKFRVYNYNVRKCSDDCATCTGPLDSQCTSCPCGFTLSSPPTSICIPVQYPCSFCKGTSSTNCKTCPGTTYLLKVNATDQVCDACLASNATLFILNTTHCIQCPAGQNPRAADGVCMDCSGNNFIDPTNRLCYSCSPNCATCSINSSHCLTCFSPKELAVDDTCINCLDSYYLQPSPRRCLACSTNCSTCSGTATNCLTCAGQYVDEITHLCDPCTKDGYSAFSDQCRRCNPTLSCRKCDSGVNQCSACAPTLFVSISNSSCAACGDGYFVRSPDSKCESCSSNCVTCQNTNTECHSCLIPLILSSVNSTCMDCSGNNFIHPTTNKCTPCDANCATCSSTPVNCMTCPNGKTLTLSNTCVVCSVNNFVDVTTNPPLCRQCSFNCSACLGNSTNCTACDGAQWVNTISHTCDPCITAGYGQISGLCQQCNTSKNCLSCSSSLDICNSCAAPLKVHFVNKSCAECGTSFFLDTNSTPEYCKPCDANCFACTDSSTKCTACAAGQYLDDNMKCDPCSKEGYSVIGSLCKKCLITNCNRCSQSSSTCSECATGYFVAMNNTVTTCEQCSTNCLKCYGYKTNCTSCTFPLFLVENNTCTECTLPGRYLSSDNSCAVCSATCLECVGKANNCTRCDETEDLFLDPFDNSCQLRAAKPTIKVQIGIVTNPVIADGVHFAGIVSIMKPIILDGTIVQKIFSGFRPSSRFIATETSTVETPEVKVQIGTVGFQGFLTLVLTGLLESNTYTLELAAESSTIVDAGDTFYEVIPFNFSFVFKNPKAGKALIVTSVSQGAAVGGLVAGLPVSSPAGMDIISAAVSADPTGITTKASQVMKLFNRVFYLNVNYGDRLGAFLESIEKVSATQRDSPSSSIRYQQTSGWRGKLSTNNVAGDFWAAFNWKIAIYLLLWILKAVFAYCALIRANLPRWQLMVMYWLPKVRLIVVNMVLIDFTFYATHSMAHFSSFPVTQLSLLCLTLIVVDILNLYSSCLDERMWSRYCSHYKIGFDTSIPRSQVQPPVQSPVSNLSCESINNFHDRTAPSKDTSNAKFSSEPAPEAAKGIPSITIDYPSTYAAIKSDFHIVALLASSLRLDRAVYKLPAARLLTVIHLIRISLYQIVIAVCQQASGLAVISLMCIEVIKLVWVVWIEIRHRVLTTRVALVSEVMQSLLLIMFLLLVATVHSKRMSESISGFVQSFGMKLIIIAVVSEYVLLAVSIGIKAMGAYRAYKLSKQSSPAADNKLNAAKPKVNSFNWFIIYKAECHDVESQEVTITRPKKRRFMRKTVQINSNMDTSSPQFAMPSKKITGRVIQHTKLSIESTDKKSLKIVPSQLEKTSNKQEKSLKPKLKRIRSTVPVESPVSDPQATVVPKEFSKVNVRRVKAAKTECKTQNTKSQKTKTNVML